MALYKSRLGVLTWTALVGPIGKTHNHCYDCGEQHRRLVQDNCSTLGLAQSEGMVT